MTASPPPLRPPRAVAAPAAAARPVRADPRIAARRVAVLRDQGRRRLHRLLVVLAALAVPLAGIAATRTPLLDVDRLEIDLGAAQVDAALLHAVHGALAGAGVRTGTLLVEVDEERARAALASLPAVASADVERRWPDAVRVVVEPRTPVAAVAARGGGVALVAGDGVVVAVVPAAPPDLVSVGGLSAPGEAGSLLGGRRAADVLAVAAVLPTELRARVSAVAPGPGDDVELELVDGGVVRLGPADGLSGKLAAVTTTFAQVDLTCLGTLDVRVPSAPAITRQPGCEAT